MAPPALSSFKSTKEPTTSEAGPSTSSDEIQPQHLDPEVLEDNSDASQTAAAKLYYNLLLVTVFSLRKTLFLAFEDFLYQNFLFLIKKICFPLDSNNFIN
ncbi:hypothetical protein CAEBREN_08527 [Caenorhabditis brenneri]|uniref:Uncharacterized protein n=1 Tax=Caenorhabditis brenneri TaxID=135651 RepID=G0P870_CAEBE|nr:hypothetical protein CAEBREN_08527 [Caenorhabditis brenneri]